MTKKRPLPEKNLSIITRVFISDSILCHFIIWEQMAQFLFHRKYLGNDKKKEKKWNWKVTHHYLIFFFLTLLEIGSLFFIFSTLLEIGSLVLRLCIVVSD